MDKNESSQEQEVSTEENEIDENQFNFGDEAADETRFDEIEFGDEQSVEEQGVAPEQAVTEEPVTEQPIEQPQQQTPQETDYSSHIIKSDDKGNLIDGNGNIVASAGYGVRAFNNALKKQNAVIEQRVTDQMAQASTMIRDLQSKVQQQDSVNEQFKKFGGTQEEMLEAAQIYREWDKDPVGTLKYLVDAAQKAGHDLSSIVAGGNNINDIEKMIEQKLAPITQEQQARVQYQQQQQAAQQQMHAFVQKYPLAPLHEQILAHRVGNDPSLTPEVAYLQLESWAAREGYDMGKPLPQQMQERQNPKPAMSPRPNNQGLSARSTNMDSQSVQTSFNHDSSWDTILKGSL